MNQYTATKWEPAEAKDKFEKQFKRFCLGGFQFHHFPKWFYQRLSNCFGMIAHYDQRGFYAEFFNSAADTADFLRLVLQYPCYGDPEFTYSDVEKILQAWVEETGLRSAYLQKANEHVEAAERAELARLQAKYGQSLPSLPPSTNAQFSFETCA